MTYAFIRTPTPKRLFKSCARAHDDVFKMSNRLTLKEGKRKKERKKKKEIKKERKKERKQ